MVLKPLLVTYIIIIDFVDMQYEWLPIITLVSLFIVFPTILVTKNNFEQVVLETIAFMLQFTPESVVGTNGVLCSLKAYFTEIPDGCRSNTPHLQYQSFVGHILATYSLSTVPVW